MRRTHSILLLYLCFLTTISCTTESTPSHTVHTTTLPLEAGNVIPSSGEFKDGEEITFEAQPNEEWTFVRWEGAATGTENPITIRVNSDESLRAVFEKKQYSLGISTEGEGQVTERVITAKDYDVNTTVEVEAIPAEGWSFLEWSGDISGDGNPRQFIIDSPKNIVANFEMRTFPLEVIIEGKGNVIKNPEKDVYSYAESVELVAEPSENWQFERWELDLTGNENPVTVTVNETTEVRAVFSKVLFYLNVTSTNGGSVDVNKITGEEENGYYSKGSEVQLTANPNDGYVFEGWVGDASGNTNPVQITIVDDTYIQTNFSKNCQPVTNCISTSFYASESSGSRVQKANISIKNILPENLTLNKISAKDEGAKVIGQESGLGIELSPGESLNFSYSLDEEPAFTDFLHYEIEFSFEYRGETYEITEKAREASSKNADQTTEFTGMGRQLF